MTTSITYRAVHEVVTLARWLAQSDGWQARTAAVIVSRDTAIAWC